MFSVEKYIVKEYDKKNYHCWHFACEVWSSLTNTPYEGQLINNFQPLADLHAEALKMTGSFAKLDSPRSPCFVLMQRQRLEPHVGIFMHGNILHLNERGAFYQPASTVTALYPTVTYYAPK